MAVDRRTDGTVRAGSVLNPTGAKFVYRTRAEEQLDRFLAEKRPDGLTMSEHIVQRILNEAGAGKPWALKLALERMLPTTQRHEVAVQGTPKSHRFTPTEAEAKALDKEMEAEGTLH